MNIFNYDEMYKHLKRIKTEKEKFILSIIIPVYNEEKTILNLLENLPISDEIEIIVIDDHSYDNSIKEIEKVKDYQRIKLIRNKSNRGYGHAILTGIKNSNGLIIVFMDSDGQHHPKDIYGLIKPILENKADFTIGSRYLGKYFYRLPITTRLGEALIEKFIRIFYFQKIQNNQGGFRAFHRKMMNIFNDIHYQGYAFATEMILQAKMYRFRIMECPINLYGRKYGKSRIILNQLALNIFSCSLRYVFKKIKTNRKYGYNC